MVKLDTKIVDVTGANIVKQAPSVKAVVPTGTQVLVERYTEAEVSGTTLTIANGDKESNQGRILAIGPLVNPQQGLVVGQRVLLQGTFVPVPSNVTNGRIWNLVIPDMIKAVLIEE